MSSIARQGWHRVKSSVAGEVGARVGDQVDRIHEPIARLQESVDRLQASVDALAGSLAVMRREVTDLADTVAVQSDVHAQTTELFGRVLQAQASRIEALEEALGAATTDG